MAKFTMTSAFLFLVGLLVSLGAPQSVFGILQEVGLVGLASALVYYLYRAFRSLRNRLLWRVSHKIIVSYAFVGVFPVLILAFMAWLSFRLIFGQVSALYLDNEVQSVTRLLEKTAQELRTEYYVSGPRTLEHLEAETARHRENFVERHPGLDRATFELFTKRRGQGRYRPTQPAPGSRGLRIPAWTESGFSGLVQDGGALYFRSVTAIQSSSPTLAVLEIPFDDSVVRYIEERTSIRLTPPSSVVSSSSPGLGLRDVFQGSEGFFTIKWMHFLSPLDWETGSSMPVFDPDISLIAITVPLEQLYYNYYFSESTGLGQLLLNFVAALGIIFVIVEVISFVIGFAIVRTITRSVQNLYVGTRRIQAGDFNFRIASGSSDQLDALATAFNNMSANLVQLLDQVSEKERLEKEIEIAREVQNQLFPQRLPEIERLDLAAQCLAARKVSGDYYDFIPYGEDRLDVIIGDISGKGISAALLMASLQSTIRTQVIYRASGDYDQGEISHAVAEINQHLYAQTAADKFATLVFSHFDSKSLCLTYCNAGHNPPFILTDGEVRWLKVGGMAAGLFADREYEEEVIQMALGDLAIFYTDGIVEAENSQGEQFGEERLVDLVVKNSFLTVDDILMLISAEVTAWSQMQEQRDDITVVVLKVESEGRIEVG